MDKKFSQVTPTTKKIHLTILDYKDEIISCRYQLADHGVFVLGNLNEEGIFTGASNDEEPVKKILFVPYQNVKVALLDLEVVPDSKEEKELVEEDERHLKFR